MRRTRTLPVLLAVLAMVAAPGAQNESGRPQNGRACGRSHARQARGHPRQGRPARRPAEVGSRQGRRVHEGLHAADGRLDLQLRGAGLPGDRDASVPRRHPEEERLHGSGGHRRHPDGVHGDVGIGQAGDRARLRHRRHPAGVAEAGGRLPRADDRGRARPRRRPQLRPGGQRHRRDRGEEDSWSARSCPGTIRIWPGTAEELVGTKAYFVREGFFKDVDVALFTHVSNDLSVSWGDRDGTGLVSVEYTFTGQTAHSAGAPWRGRSALDAVELMNIGWNYRREHLPLEHRSHYVVTNGGDQPNVVPRKASVWYYFRQTTYPKIKELWGIGDAIAKGAALMTNTELEADARARQRLAAALQQGRRRDHLGQHPEGRHAGMERGRSDARQGAAEGAGHARGRARS